MGELGVFENTSDVGNPAMKGSASFDAARNEYRVTGGGVNIWGKRDEFHFLWRQITGNVILTATMRFEGAGAAAHRKAGLMIRRGLETDAPYADALVHGDGLTALQFRETAGDTTRSVSFPVVAPTRIRLERRGNRYTLWTGRDGEPLQETASTPVPLGVGPVYVGLAVCSHLDQVLETVVFSDVALETDPPAGK
jgi:TolB protein